jgi:hypothetical protein
MAAVMLLESKKENAIRDRVFWFAMWLFFFESCGPKAVCMVAQ